MGFGIMRVAKLTTNGQMAGMDKHHQERDKVINANPELSKHNVTKYRGGENLLDSVLKRIDDSGTKRKKDSVAVIEHLITYSPESRPKDLPQFWKDSVNWAIKTYGKDNVLGYSVHYDESTPHMHLYATPIKTKEHTYKNRYGSKTVTKTTLCAKDWLGGKQKLSALQDSFHQDVSSKHGLERGVKGSKAKHESIKSYYSRVNNASNIPDIPELSIEAPKRYSLNPQSDIDKQTSEYTEKLSSFSDELKNSLISESESLSKLKSNHSREKAQLESDKKEFKVKSERLQRSLNEQIRQKENALSESKKYQNKSKNYEALKKNVVKAFAGNKKAQDILSDYFSKEIKKEMNLGKGRGI